MGSEAKELKPLIARPFVKWAGGKTQILDQLLSRVPEHFGKYYEPFLGGGALFFKLQPKNAFLSDLNAELIECFAVVKDHVEELVEELQAFKYEEEFYYKVREWDRQDSYEDLPVVKKAARLIYLNKTCFNGLYRVNAKGQFNVPFGSYKDPTICDADNLRACSIALKSAELSSDSFEMILPKVKKGDFVYLDPPYMPRDETSNFTSYTAGGFSDSLQAMLRDFCFKLNHKGVKFLLSNSAVDPIRELYQPFNIETIQAQRAINSKGDKRGEIEELLIKNY